MKVADLIARVANGLELPTDQAQQLVAMGLRFNVPIADFLEVESTPTFVVRPAMGNEYQGAGAGQYAVIVLENPTGSGVLITVDEVVQSATVNVGGQLRVGAYTGGTASPDKTWVDRRLTGAPVGIVQRNLDGAHSGTLVATRFILANSNGIYENVGIVLPPGQSLIMDLNTVNVAQTCSFRWREATLGPQKSW